LLKGKKAGDGKGLSKSREKRKNEKKRGGPVTATMDSISGGRHYKVELREGVSKNRREKLSGGAFFDVPNRGEGNSPSEGLSGYHTKNKKRKLSDGRRRNSIRGLEMGSGRREGEREQFWGSFKESGPTTHKVGANHTKDWEYL